MTLIRGDAIARGLVHSRLGRRKHVLYPFRHVCSTIIIPSKIVPSLIIL